MFCNRNILQNQHHNITLFVINKNPNIIFKKMFITKGTLSIINLIS